jgi:hypothetical protein
VAFPRRRLATLTAQVALVFAVAACASPAPTPTPGVSVMVTGTLTPTPALSPSPTPAPSADAIGSFGSYTFDMPSTWNVVWPHVWTMPVGPRLFLSDAPIADPCPTAPQPAGCQVPMVQLPENGILVTFGGSALLALPNPSPVPIVRKAGGACLQIGGDEEMGVSFQGFGVSACLRGPSLTANEAAFRRLVASMTQP